MLRERPFLALDPVIPKHRAWMMAAQAHPSVEAAHPRAKLDLIQAMYYCALFCCVSLRLNSTKAGQLL